jgi:ABC-type uncharacterized transport system permease subunit
MNKSDEKAFDFAADVTKQLITLASAILTITVTFSKDTPVDARAWAFAAWIAFILSITFGIVVLQTLTAELQPKIQPATGNQTPSIWNRAIRSFSTLQIAAFLIAVGLTINFGRKAMTTPVKDNPAKTTNCDVQLQPAPRGSGSHGATAPNQ